MKLPINKVRVGVAVATIAAFIGMAGLPATASASDYCRSHVWGYGSTGGCVKEIQHLFNVNNDNSWCGMSPSYTNLSVDGMYGSRTKAAIVYLQTKCRIHVDGIVGPQTWGYLF